MLRYAGGAPVLANPNRVQLERIDPAQPLATRFVETFRLDAAGLQTALRDGDVVTLLAISPQFANAVTLKGHVAQPLRYPYTPGMRIRDLIPDRDALITPDFYRRKNLLVQVIEDEDRVRTREDSERARRPLDARRPQHRPTRARRRRQPPTRAATPRRDRRTRQRRRRSRPPRRRPRDGDRQRVDDRSRRPRRAASAASATTTAPPRRAPGARRRRCSTS